MYLKDKKVALKLSLTPAQAEALDRYVKTYHFPSRQYVIRMLLQAYLVPIGGDKNENVAAYIVD